MYPLIDLGLGLPIYTYPLFMGISWGVGYQLFLARLDHQFRPHLARIYFWGLFIFSWIGAKLFFLMTTKTSQMVDPISLHFWLGGGFVFYGGLTAGLVFSSLFLKYYQLPARFLVSLVPALCIGHGIGRLGCFFSGCCYGGETSLPWGIYMHSAHRHPTQLLEAIFLFLSGFIFLKFKKSSVKILPLYFMGYASFRFLIEFLRGDEVRGIWAGLTTSQWISIFFVILGAFLLRKQRFSEV